jgi:hypothetical protein
LTLRLNVIPFATALFRFTLTLWRPWVAVPGPLYVHAVPAPFVRHPVFVPASYDPPGIVASSTVVPVLPARRKRTPCAVGSRGGAGRQTVLEAWKPLPGHVGLTPSQVSATSQTAAAVRQISPFGRTVQAAVQQLPGVPFAAPASQPSPASTTPSPHWGINRKTPPPLVPA